jgi:transposase-like protein
MVKVEEKGASWQELTGEDRWRVIEEIRQGKIQVAELCRRFGINRQTLYRALRAAEEGAQEALEPKAAGRKQKSASERQVERLKQELAQREEELARWRQKYEVTKALLNLERKLAKGESLPGEERKKLRKKS